MKNTITHIAIIALLSVFTGCDSDKKDQIATATISEANSMEATSKTMEQDDYLYVTAPSGLSLREYNNLDSKKLTVMPYGTKVKLIAVEENETMTVVGIKGGMNQVEYNNKTGYAFNGYLSSFFPPEKGSNAKQYIEDLKASHPTATYSKTTGGTASKPTETETVLLPTTKWHEGFTFAQRLFDVPMTFAFPKNYGHEVETLENPKPADYMYTSNMLVLRKEKELSEIQYSQTGESYNSTVTISKEGDMMKIEYVTVVD
jgi:hypothetical protein